MDEIVETFQEYVELAKAFAPMAEQIVDVIFKFTPAAKTLVDAMQEYIVESTIKTFNSFLIAGFDRQEALDLTLAMKIDWAKIGNQIAKQ